MFIRNFQLVQPRLDGKQLFRVCDLRLFLIAVAVVNIEDTADSSVKLRGIGGSFSIWQRFNLLHQFLRRNPEPAKRESIGHVDIRLRRHGCFEHQRSAAGGDIDGLVVYKLHHRHIYSWFGACLCAVHVDRHLCNTSTLGCNLDALRLFADIDQIIVGFLLQADLACRVAVRIQSKHRSLGIAIDGLRRLRDARKTKAADAHRLSLVELKRIVFRCFIGRQGNEIRFPGIDQAIFLRNGTVGKVTELNAVFIQQHRSGAVRHVQRYLEACVVEGRILGIGVQRYLEGVEFGVKQYLRFRGICSRVLLVRRDVKIIYS